MNCILLKRLQCSYKILKIFLKITKVCMNINVDVAIYLTMANTKAN